MLFGVLVANNIVVSERTLFTETKTTLATMTQHCFDFTIFGSF